MHDKSLIPLSDFLKAYRQCRRHKRNTPSAQEFELDYESNLTVKQSQESPPLQPWDELA